MFDIGFWELVILGIVALLVVGPDRLPGFAREAGRWFRRIRSVANNARRELQRELDWEENSGSWKDIGGLQKELEEDTGGLQKKLGEMDQLMKDAPDRQPGHKPEYSATGPSNKPASADENNPGATTGQDKE